ncbi:MAG: SMP-30/gluconolactonase/LRE family protein [Thermogemmatispora sp.]|jgi:gluconolactonase|nr:SMP-30/gluconolactonase/LRE family protein [Thermogemmatispora sp.]MBE3568153.1 SMP-30/gluconolactonase/LRE family protein [Thermogemmatispora sp.]
MSDSHPPIKEFRLELSALTYTGHDLVRPESIIAQPDGTLWTSDGRGGVMRIAPDGSQQFFGGLGGEPNGLAMARDGSLYIANIGNGRIQRLFPDGHSEDVLTEVDGVPTTCANYVFIDSKDRLWLAFSTREQQWWPAAAQPRPDGYIVLLDEKGPRIVYDGIYFTNEIRLDAKEEFLYVAETMKNRILRFRVQPDGSLTDKEVFGPDGLGVGAVVDGFAFDAEGNVWVTTPLRNGLGIITTDGDYHVVFEEANEEVLSTFEEKVASGTATPADMAACAGRTLQSLTSITFGGPDLRTVYIGSLAMSRLPTFRSPVPGLPMRHWAS